jgi:hypothetical protein
MLKVLPCLLAALVAVAVPALGKPPQPQDQPHVYLLIGQSNMAGRAKMEKADTEPIERCFLLNADDAWEPATNPLNRHSTIRKGLGMQKIGPGASFAQAMAEKNPEITIGLVVNAKGGTKIGQWKRGTKFYTEAVRRTQAARKSGTLKGIVWHQGESDGGAPEGYLDALAQLIADLRKDLGVADLPFVAGQVKDLPAINDQIAKLPDTVEHTAFISSEGLKTTDRWHFDAPSVRLMGERYAEAMIRLQQARD